MNIQNHEPDFQLLTLLISFSNELSHQLRTPLSVIKNDLSYFESLIDPAECERSKRKCDEIVALLDPVANSTNQNPEEITVDDLVNFFKDGFTSINGHRISGTILCFPKLLRNAISLLMDFLSIPSKKITFHIDLQNSYLILTTKISHLQPKNSAISKATSLTEYLNQNGEANTHLPAYVEIILLAHNFKVVVQTLENNLCYKISVPFHSDSRNKE